MSAGADALLLLGVALGENDEATPELRARVMTAAALYHGVGPVRIVACGGRTGMHRAAEADVMAALLVQAGVPERDILREDGSRTTMENFMNAAALLGGAKGKRVLVVTGDYHMRRALMTARRVGFRAKGYPAALMHDGAWKRLRAKELGYTADLLLGWQDVGRSRPDWAVRLFDAVFGGH